MNLSEFLICREKEICLQIRELRKELFAIRNLSKENPKARVRKKKTIQEKVIEILSDSIPRSSRELSEEIGVVRTSLTPQLSRLLQKGILDHHNKKWKIK